MTPKSLRVLFVLQYPLYLRHFETVIRTLADHGHRVYLAYDTPHKMSEGAEALAGAGERVVVLGGAPKRHDRWAAVARSVRGAIDYGRYLHPRFAQAPYLRGRMTKTATPLFSFLTRIETLPPARLRLLLRSLLAMERAIPSNPAVEAFIRSVDPDVVVVTPLVNKISNQTDLLKSAQALGIPTALCVGSWDHLTTKGLIRVEPDCVIVWNEIQRSEAAEFHYVAPEKVVVTGAQTFDRWFGRRPSTRRDEFCAKVGLPDERPFVLFTGSTATISAPDAEQQFVRRWIRALRESDSAALRDLAVLVRPHPYNPGTWASADLSGLGAVAVWPRGGANPVRKSDQNDYFDSLYHSAAVVGVNTSAMIEAAILERPVHSILAPEFADTQSGTLHFQYLLPENGGFLRVATSFPAHLEQLAESVTQPEVASAQARRFVSSFVRPNGLERPSTPQVVEAIEQLGASGRRQPASLPIGLYPVRAGLWLAAQVTVLRNRERLGRTIRKRGRQGVAQLRIMAREMLGRPAPNGNGRHATNGSDGTSASGRPVESAPRSDER